MYGIATKQAKSKVESMNKDKIKELVQLALQQESDAVPNVTSDLTKNVDTGFSGRADYGEEDKALGQEDELEMKGLEEALNPEVSQAVNRFIKAMAKRYSYSEQDAVFAIMAALKQRKFDGLNEAEGSTINLSQSDMDKLHNDGKLDLDGHKIVYVDENEQSVFDFANPTGGPTLDPYPRKVGKGTGKSYINRPSGPAKFPEGIDEDLDIGHQDDEPGMLKRELARAGQMVQMLYRAIDKYDGQGEVDFPQWWQAKIIKANAMLDSAFDYLDGEEMVAKIDAMIDNVEVNEGVVKDMYTYLNDLRDSGVTNMFGASPYLQKEFGLDKKEARGVLANWMQSFSESLDEEVSDADYTKGIEVIKKTLSKEGGAAGLEPLVKELLELGFKKKDVIKLLKDMTSVKKHRDGDYILLPLEEGVFDQYDALPRRGNLDFNDVLYLRGEVADLKDEISQIYRDMEQEAEPEGGEVANMYGNLLNKAEEKLYRMQKQLDDYDMNESVNEAIDGGQLFDYFANKGYVVKDRRPDGYPPKEGVEGYIVKDSDDSGKRRSNPGQMVIFQYNKDTDQFTISQLGGYSIDKKDAIKAGMREEGGSSVAGMDYYITDGNYTPVDISAEGLKDIVDHVMGGLSREAKRQSDYYKDRGPISGVGNMDEEVTSPEDKKLKKISKELDKASKMHKGQSERIANMVKEKLTKSSSVEDHIDDFKDSDAPQFKGKSLDKIKKMALASFLSKQKK